MGWQVPTWNLKAQPSGLSPTQHTLALVLAVTQMSSAVQKWSRVSRRRIDNLPLYHLRGWQPLEQSAGFLHIVFFCWSAWLPTDTQFMVNSMCCMSQEREKRETTNVSCTTCAICREPSIWWTHWLLYGSVTQRSGYLSGTVCLHLFPCCRHDLCRCTVTVPKTLSDTVCGLSHITEKGTQSKRDQSSQCMQMFSVQNWQSKP